MGERRKPKHEHMIGTDDIARQVAPKSLRGPRHNLVIIDEAPMLVPPVDPNPSRIDQAWVDELLDAKPGPILPHQEMTIEHLQVCQIAGCDHPSGGWVVTAKLLPGVRATIEICDCHYDQIKDGGQHFSIAESEQ